MDAHPEIISIIKKRDEIHYLLYNRRDYENAINQMLGLLYELEEKDQDKDFTEELIREITILEQNRSATANRARMKRRSMIYREWLQKINRTLWVGGYLKNEKYGMGIIPTKTMKVENAPPTVKHYGEKLPSDLA